VCNDVTIIPLMSVASRFELSDSCDISIIKIAVDSRGNDSIQLYSHDIRLVHALSKT